MSQGLKVVVTSSALLTLLAILNKSKTISGSDWINLKKGDLIQTFNMDLKYASTSRNKKILSCREINLRENFYHYCLDAMRPLSLFSRSHKIPLKIWQQIGCLRIVDYTGPPGCGYTGLYRIYWIYRVLKHFQRLPCDLMVVSYDLETKVISKVKKKNKNLWFQFYQGWI